MNCQASGFPDPVVTWFNLGKGSDPLVSEGRIKILPNGTMIIHEIVEHDSGQYECLATNGLGTKINKIIKLIINGMEDKRALKYEEK